MMVTPKTIKCTKETETREEVEEEAMMENIPEEIDNTKERLFFINVSATGVTLCGCRHSNLEG